MPKQPRTERVSNKDVLDKIKKQRYLWKNTQFKRGKMIGHILLKNIVEEDVEGNIARRRDQWHNIQV